MHYRANTFALNPTIPVMHPVFDAYGVLNIVIGPINDQLTGVFLINFNF